MYQETLYYDFLINLFSVLMHFYLLFYELIFLLFPEDGKCNVGYIHCRANDLLMLRKSFNLLIYQCLCTMSEVSLVVQIQYKHCLTLQIKSAINLLRMFVASSQWQPCLT